MTLSGPEGNPNTTTFTSAGCPVFSAGESQHTETLFIVSHPLVLGWLQEVAATPSEEKPYLNPKFPVFFTDSNSESLYWNGDEKYGEWNGKGKVEGDDAVKEQEKEKIDGQQQDNGLKIITRDNVMEEKELGGAGDDEEAQAEGKEKERPSKQRKTAKSTLFTSTR
jgi:hypothetical protein